MEYVMTDTKSQLLELTADIVSSHVANNKVAVNDVPALLQQVHQALSGLGEAPAVPAAEKRQPAVSVRSSVKPDTITCLICGQASKMLKRHLGTAHSLTPDEYRREFGLRPDYPMVAPNYAEARRGLALKIGLGRKRKSVAEPASAPKAPVNRRGKRTN